jgi:hypothetical protein
MSAPAPLVRLSGLTPRPTGDDVQVTRVQVFDTRAWITFRYDRSEAARRRAYTLGAVLNWELLDTLMDLPAGLPVPVNALPGPARRRIANAAPGVARIAGGDVTRDLIPAVAPLLAIVSARDWGNGLTQASRFASYCRRMVVGSGLIAGAEVLEAAARLGIGVAVDTASGPARVLLEPEPVPDWQPTTAWWRFCEVTYGHAARRCS